MITIMQKGRTVINADNADDVTRMLADGWRELTPAEIAAAGMTGHEHLVGPHNTTVGEDGTITFAPPAPPSVEELFARLRDARNVRLTATDKYLLADYPLSAGQLVAIKAYRQALRDMPETPGAPWDGGGEATPWPEQPDV